MLNCGWENKTEVASLFLKKNYRSNAVYYWLKRGLMRFTSSSKFIKFEKLFEFITNLLIYRQIVHQNNGHS